MSAIRRIGLFSVLLLFAGCANPGTLTVSFEPQRSRLDVAAADVFRVAPEDRRAMVKKLVVATRTLIADSSENFTGDVRLRDVQYNAWVSEFEREFTRRDIHVMDRAKLEDLLQEGDIAAERAAELLGADALFQINVLEVIPSAQQKDLRDYQLFRTTPEGPKQIEFFPVADFHCRVDAKLIRADGTLLWSGEIHLPASSLLEENSWQLIYTLSDKQDGGPNMLTPPTPNDPNPMWRVAWKGEALDLAPLEGKLPQGLTPDYQELVRVLSKFTARQFVRDIFESKSEL